MQSPSLVLWSCKFLKMKKRYYVSVGAEFGSPTLANERKDDFRDEQELFTLSLYFIDVNKPNNSILF